MTKKAKNRKLILVYFFSFISAEINLQLDIVVKILGKLGIFNLMGQRLCPPL